MDNAFDKTFLTGLDPSVGATDNVGMSHDELIMHVERQMKDFERNAQYVEAEKARQHLANLRSRQHANKKRELDRIQQEDVKVFFSMVAQHQENFDRTWQKKTLEHKLRADDLIDALKWKHDDQQRELYEQLRQKRMPKFSVELLNLRKKQVMLAKARAYLQAEKIKRKADVMEAVEIDKIRRQAKDENQSRFEALLKRQRWDREALASKLKTEKKALLEAKAADFGRLKKRLRNAEAELKKTHVRQALQSERKLAPLYSTVSSSSDRGDSSARPTSRGRNGDAVNGSGEVGGRGNGSTSAGPFVPHPPNQQKATTAYSSASFRRGRQRRSARVLAQTGREPTAAATAGADVTNGGGGVGGVQQADADDPQLSRLEHPKEETVTLPEPEFDMSAMEAPAV